MQRLALLTLLLAGFMMAATAQEEAEAPADAAVTEEETEATSPEAEATEDAEEAADELPIDDEFYQDVDDEDFRPSEDIPADQSITFPTDI